MGERRINDEFGTMMVDWEKRIDFARLRRDRVAKAQQAIADSEADVLFLSHRGCPLSDSLWPPTCAFRLSIGLAEEMIGLGQALSSQMVVQFGETVLMVLSAAIGGIDLCRAHLCRGLGEQRSPALTGARRIIPDGHGPERVAAAADAGLGLRPLQVLALVTTKPMNRPAQR